ncbi:NTP transferase domain-containing protein [Algoriphagus halophilus]|uniref:NTP transferase domain-containing protein n=1 Tax=Algoriphagus halophilus TaxID=226505 RepID=UPI0035900B60
MKTGIIILAAGESSRLGYPKQIARYKDKTLLQYAIDAANGSKADKKVLVLGAFKDEIKRLFLEPVFLIFQIQIGKRECPVH